MMDVVAWISLSRPSALFPRYWAMAAYTEALGYALMENITGGYVPYIQPDRVSV